MDEIPKNLWETPQKSFKNPENPSKILKILQKWTKIPKNLWKKPQKSSKNPENPSKMDENL